MGETGFAREAVQGAIAWSDAFLLGFPPLDDVHREFVLTLQALQRADDGTMADCLDVFADHARRHFEQEDGWMRETAFPASGCHLDEHAAVMASVAQVREKVAQGDFAEGRRLAAALADWFPGHADYLDAALSHWMCKLRWQGKPVVLRRGVASAPTAV